MNTKDNWIKAFDNHFKELGFHNLPLHQDIRDEVKSFISQVEKDAIEKTNKRWVERLAKFSRMGEISEKEVLQDFIKNKSDLLEDK